MTVKTKAILSICAFAVFIVGSVLLYNYLKDLEPAPPVLATQATRDLSTTAPSQDIQVEDTPGTVATDPPADDRTPAPDITVYDADNNPVLLSSMQGKPVVLNFWASWCPPCKSEMPHFDTVNAELGQSIHFMMVDLTDGARETVDIGKAYIEEQGFSFPVYFDIDNEAGYVYGIRSIPTTLFIDKDGYIVAGVQGAIDEATLRQGIEMILPK